jgi:TolB-like protein
MKTRSLFILIIGSILLASCASVDKHIFAPREPQRADKRIDFSQTDFILTSFQVYNLDIKDNVQDIDYLRNKFIRYIIAQNKFRDIRDVNLTAKTPDDQSYFNVEVVVYPDYSKYRTIILDIPFFYPATGIWPITPLWGKATVKVRCDLYDRKGELIKSFNIEDDEKYLMIFYSWYRTAPIEDALRKAYEGAFIKAAKTISDNRDYILAQINPLKIRISESKNAVFTGNKIDSLKKSIAVLNLDAYGISNADASALSNRLTTELFKSNYFNVVEREKTNEILDEQGFQLSGCTSSECLVEAGKLLNVELMLGGSVSKVGNYYSIELRIIDVESGAILSVASVDIQGDIGKVLVDGIREAVQKIIKQ